MPSLEFMKNEEKAALVEEFKSVIRRQGAQTMDFIRARAYWETKLPTVPAEILASALAEALSYAIPGVITDEVRRIHRDLLR